MTSGSRRDKMGSLPCQASASMTELMKTQTKTEAVVAHFLSSRTRGPKLGSSVKDLSLNCPSELLSLIIIIAAASKVCPCQEMREEIHDIV